jgi:pyruvate/2-oxoacid:ferredoxin oxidoreductase beta subunit
MDVTKERNNIFTDNFVWNASKPSKKMPSYKPLPKLCAYDQQEKQWMTKMRSHSSSTYTPVWRMEKMEREEKKNNKIVISKKQIKYSSNKESLDLKTETKNKAHNTYQPKFLAKQDSSPPKKRV